MNERLQAASKRPPPRCADALTLADIRREPLAFISDLAKRYGDIVAYGVPGWSAVLINRPDHVRHLLVDNFRNYSKLDTPDMMMLKPMLGEGLLTVDGAEWVRQRRMLKPVFHPASIRPFAPDIVAATEAMLGEWARLPPERPVEIVGEMTALTLRIVARALFGYEVAGESDRFGRAVEGLNETMGHLDPNDEANRRRFHSSLRVVQETVRRVVAERLSGTGPAEGRDALSLMMAEMDLAPGEDAGSRRELVDQVLTLLLAGHETTAKALSWTLHLLAENPQAMALLREEIARVLGDRVPEEADLDAMPYTFAVLQEAMRIYPPIWLMSRKAIGPDEIGGYAIAAGTLLVFSPFLMHRLEAFWPEPLRFRPERFLADGAAISESAYIPFSGGPRHCVGKHFAALEMRLVLPMIVRRFDLALTAGHVVEPQALVTLRPRFGLPMHISARERAA